MTAYEMRISDWSADVCSSDLVDRDQRRAEAHQIEIVALGEEIGQPEQEHPPDRIGEELAERERPGLAVAQQLEPRDLAGGIGRIALDQRRSEEHTSELQSLMRISYAVFCLNKKTIITHPHSQIHTLYQR